MPICIVCAECLPVRNGKPSGASFDCDLLKHGQHKPRPSKGWSVGPLMLVGLPPHKRTDPVACEHGGVKGGRRRLAPPPVGSRWHPHGRVLEGGLGAGGGQGQGGPPQPQASAVLMAWAWLVLALFWQRESGEGLRWALERGSTVLRAADAHLHRVRRMPSRPQRQAVGACFDCDLLKHGQHKPRPSKARCLRTWRRQGRPATACTPDRRLPVAPHTGRVWSSSSSVARDPEISSTWLAKCRQSRHARLPHGSWGMLLGALASSPSPAKVEASHRQVGPVPRFCSSVPNSCFVPNLRAYRGMLGRACCRSPAATLECVVGRRALACLLGHCVRNGRVSGDWRVWACWIPARAATTSPASRFSRRPKRAPALAAVGFLCCIPIAKAFHCPERPVFALRCTPRGRGAGWTSRRPLCPTSRARPHVPGSLAHCVVARSLGCGTHGGYEASASVCPESKRSALRANDARHRFGLVPCGRRGRYSLFDGTCYSDNRSNSRANTCNKPRLLEGMHLLDKRSTRAPPVAAMIHDNSTDRTALVPATHHSNFCPINFRWVRFRRGSLRNGYHIQGRQQARKLPNPDTGRIHWRASLVPAAAVIPAPIAWTLGWAGRSASGVHRSSRPFCRRCAPGLNWPGRASGAVTLKKLECSKQAYALYTLAWDNIIGFRSYYVGLRDRTFAKDVFINQERKLGARRRSDTVLVSTINDADQGSADVAFRTPPAPYEKSKSLGSGGSMVARLKLKGIDGRAPPGVEPAA
ncbi:UNVERIFIED_CONTAM: hypothetical protein Sindi_2991200 [Sesamum indicum]